MSHATKPQQASHHLSQFICWQHQGRPGRQWLWGFPISCWCLPIICWCFPIICCFVTGSICVLWKRDNTILGVRPRRWELTQTLRGGPHIKNTLPPMMPLNPTQELVSGNFLCDCWWGGGREGVVSEWWVTWQEVLCTKPGLLYYNWKALQWQVIWAIVGMFQERILFYSGKVSYAGLLARERLTNLGFWAVGWLMEVFDKVACAPFYPQHCKIWRDVLFFGLGGVWGLWFLVCLLGGFYSKFVVLWVCG